jgi:hypothetical protein
VTVECRRSRHRVLKNLETNELMTRVLKRDLNSQKRDFCTYAKELQPVTLDVLYCIATCLGKIVFQVKGIVCRHFVKILVGGWEKKDLGFRTLTFTVLHLCLAWKTIFCRIDRYIRNRLFACAR